MADSSDRMGDEPDLSSESDGDLLVYMSLRADDAAYARAAWATFYQRHAPYLYGVCRRALAAVPHYPGTPEDLVQDTFHRVYEHAGSFDAGRASDPDGLRLLVRAWLGAIARTLIRDRLRGRQTELPEDFLAPKNWSGVQARADCEDPPSPLLAIAREVMETDLSPEEREVLRVTYEWHDPDRTNQRLPNDVAADLATRLNTTSENFRKIRQRALRKFKDGVQARLRQAPITR